MVDIPECWLWKNVDVVTGVFLGQHFDHIVNRLFVTCSIQEMIKVLSMQLALTLRYSMNFLLSFILSHTSKPSTWFTVTVIATAVGHGWLLRSWLIVVMQSWLIVAMAVVVDCCLWPSSLATPKMKSWCVERTKLKITGGGKIEPRMIGAKQVRNPVFLNSVCAHFSLAAYPPTLLRICVFSHKVCIFCTDYVYLSHRKCSSVFLGGGAVYTYSWMWMRPPQDSTREGRHPCNHGKGEPLSNGEDTEAMPNQKEVSVVANDVIGTFRSGWATFQSVIVLELWWV